MAGGVAAGPGGFVRSGLAVAMSVARQSGTAAAAAVAIGACPDRAEALMAGTWPDTPAERVDPNRLASRWAGVGAVSVGDKVYTGSLVHPRFALTAASAVAGQAPDRIRFVTNFDEGGGNFLAVRAVHVHPLYQGFVKPFAYYDLALLELARPIVGPVPGYTIGYEPLKPGTDLALVGYGRSGNGDRGIDVLTDPTVKRVGGNQADRFVSLPGKPGTQAIFMFDFDGPGAPNVMGSAQGLGNATETTAATGDSGAPAFVLTRTRFDLVGIVTFVSDGRGKRARKPGTFGTVGGGVLLQVGRQWLGEMLGPAGFGSGAAKG